MANNTTVNFDLSAIIKMKLTEALMNDTGKDIPLSKMAMVQSLTENGNVSISTT